MADWRAAHIANLYDKCDAATARAERAEAMADTWICKAGKYEGIMADQRIALEGARAEVEKLRADRDYWRSAHQELTAYYWGRPT